MTATTIENSIFSLIVELKQSCTGDNVTCKINELEQSLLRAREQFQSMKKELDRSNQQLEKKSRENQRLRQKLSDLEETNEQLEEENESLREQNDFLEEEVNELEDQIAEMEEFAVEEAARKMQLEEEIADNMGVINELQHKVEKAERKFRLDDIPEFVEFVIFEGDEEEFDDYWGDELISQGLVTFDMYTNEIIAIEEKQVDMIRSPTTPTSQNNMILDQQEHFQTPILSSSLPENDDDEQQQQQQRQQQQQQRKRRNLEAAIAAKLQIDTSKLQQVLGMKSSLIKGSTSSNYAAPYHHRDPLSSATTTRSPVSVVH